jgi:hypothetical protein
MTERRALLLVLLLLGAAAALAILPGVFTIDEDNYLAWIVSLRAGGLTLPGTGGLPWSPELLSFDPVASARAPGAIASVVPPLYALFALPFSVLGFFGLALPNLAAWLVTTALIYRSARRLGTSQAAAWIGALAFALAGFSVEYAVGVWPHALSACLCFAAFVTALRAAEDGPTGWAWLAGLLAGLAAGVRYQNAAMAGMIGLVVMATSVRKLRSTVGFGLGILLPLSISTVANGLRAGIWHPFSKGRGYAAVGGLSASVSRWDPVRSALGRVVDFSIYPRDSFWTDMGGRYGQSGALLLLSAVKKALLQSAPWILIVAAAAFLSWMPWSSGSRREAKDAARTAERSIATIIAGLVLMFGLAGTGRQEGWSNSQRYLFDLVPFAALLVAMLVDRCGMRWKEVALGAGGGGLLGAIPLLFSPASFTRQWSLLRVPLVLALLATLLWLAARRWTLFRRPAAWGLGACLGWAAVVHLGDDLPAARALREMNYGRLQTMETLLPQCRAALFTFKAVPLGPLLLDRDVVLADTAIDDGRDAGMLVEAFQRAGRRVFAVLPSMPETHRQALLHDRRFSPVGAGDSLLVEIGPRLSP